MFEGLFGLIGLFCGAYCLYAYYMLKVKKEINQTILLPKEARIRKCKDIEGYSKEMGPPLLTLGVVITLYGVVDLYSSTVGKMGPLFYIMFVLFWVALVWFVVAVRKVNKKYFGM